MTNFFMVLAAKETVPPSVQQGICPRTSLSVKSAPKCQCQRQEGMLNLFPSALLFLIM